MPEPFSMTFTCADGLPPMMTLIKSLIIQKNERMLTERQSPNYQLKLKECVRWRSALH